MREQQGQASAPELADYITLGSWVELQHNAAVPTRSSADWIVKQYRRELVECGALIPGRGRTGSLVHRALFPRAVVAILKRRALERAA